MDKNPGRLLPLLTTWMIFTASFPTILLYRAAVQPNYQWGLFGITGEGLSLGYILIVVASLWAWSTVFLGMQEGRPPFGILLSIWNAFLTASMIVGVLRFGSSLDIRGDAMGLRVNIAVVGPLLCGVILLLSLFWWWGHRNDHAPSARFQWPRSSKILLGVVLALVPVIVALFVLGDGLVHTSMDRWAIGLIIVQCILTAMALGMQELPN